MAPDHPERAAWAPPATDPVDVAPPDGAVALAVLDEPAPPAPNRVRALEIVFLAGLAGVFLVNAVVAVVQPSDFTSLVENSTVARWFRLDGADWVGPLIFVNDLLLGLGLLCGIWSRHTTRVVILAWAGVWFFLVTAVKLTSL
jgi:hypothetical protein